MSLSARQRAERALMVGRDRARLFENTSVTNDLEAMFRAHATEAVNLARQEWEAQQAESGFRAYATGSAPQFRCADCGDSLLDHAIDDEERRECTICECKQYVTPAGP